MPEPLQMLLVGEDGTVKAVGRVKSYEIRIERGQRIEYVVDAMQTTEEPWI